MPVINENKCFELMSEYISVDFSQVHSEPPRDRDVRVRPAYSEPHLRYNDPDQQDEYGPRARYEDEDFRNGNKPAGFKEDTLDRQRPGYKPSGNVVK